MPKLTARQEQIAQLVTEGLTEQEIGDRLNLSRHTVRNHKQVIFHKTGARNAVELTRMRLGDAA